MAALTGGELRPVVAAVLTDFEAMISARFAERFPDVAGSPFGVTPMVFAFRLFERVNGSRARRVPAMVLVAPIIAVLWVVGTAFLMRRDPSGPGRPRLGGYRPGANRGILPPLATCSERCRVICGPITTRRWRAIRPPPWRTW